MINGVIEGIVEDNRDPSGLHRIKVRFPLDENVVSSWCRICSPMAGPARGLVLLPEIGTEVVLMFYSRSLTPVVVGSVYNGTEDRPAPYNNADGCNNHRVLQSRSGHTVDFDDTSGGEKLLITAARSSHQNNAPAPIRQTLDAAKRQFTIHCDGSSLTESKRNISIRCKRLDINIKKAILIAKKSALFASKTIQLRSDAIIRSTSPDTQVFQYNTRAPRDTAAPAAPHRHPPIKN